MRHESLSSISIGIGIYQRHYWTSKIVVIFFCSSTNLTHALESQILILKDPEYMVFEGSTRPIFEKMLSNVRIKAQSNAESMVYITFCRADTPHSCVYSCSLQVEDARWQFFITNNLSHFRKTGEHLKDCMSSTTDARAHDVLFLTKSYEVQKKIINK